MKNSTYVLITPVRNEEATIETTLRAVTRQTIPPKEWVIVSDQSTDRTDEIVKAYVASTSYIRLLQLANRPRRNFASVVFALQAGIGALETKEYDFIGLLDADIDFGERYYEEMLLRFGKDPNLGLAGGLVVDCHEGMRRKGLQSSDGVAGAVQFFRRNCFESLGGLIALPEGGWDTITCAQVRMNGFCTRTFPEIEVDHLKPRNIAEGNVLKRFWQFGVREYAVGNHPLFEVLKCGYQCLKYPFLVGGIMQMMGYCSSCIRRRKRALSVDIVRFRRGEQLTRLFRFGRTTGCGQV